MSIFGVTLAISFLAGCHLYEDYFTPEGKLYQEVNGAYGKNANCSYEAMLSGETDGKDWPLLVILDHYDVYNRSCRLEEVIEDGNGFILKSKSCIIYTERLSGGDFSSEVIAPFEIRVEAINDNVIVLQEIGKEAVKVIKCGSQIN